MNKIFFIFLSFIALSNIASAQNYMNYNYQGYYAYKGYYPDAAPVEQVLPAEINTNRQYETDYMDCAASADSQASSASEARDFGDGYNVKSSDMGWMYIFSGCMSSRGHFMGS